MAEIDSSSGATKPGQARSAFAAAALASLVLTGLAACGVTNGDRGAFVGNCDSDVCAPPGSVAGQPMLGGSVPGGGSGTGGTTGTTGAASTAVSTGGFDAGAGSMVAATTGTTGTATASSAIGTTTASSAVTGANAGVTTAATAVVCPATVPTEGSPCNPETSTTVCTFGAITCSCVGTWVCQ